MELFREDGCMTDAGFRAMCSCPVTACAGGTNAVGDAFHYIRDGYAEVMLCGGTEASITPMSIGGFTSMKALTQTEDPNRASIPFDAERSGFVMGEGAGVLLLEELEHAKARGAKIYAEVVGYGANCDAYHFTAPAPGGAGAIDCMALTLADAGIAPEQVDHINAHGGGFLRHGGKVWWFGEHKVPGNAGNYAHVGVHCYSSDENDLVNWKDEGIALRVSDDPASDIAKGCILERPKVIHNAKTGKFVMWFHLELKGQGYSSARSGVAVADRPEGPYAFLRSGRVNPGKWPENIPADKRTLAGTPKAETQRGSQFPEGMDNAALFYRDFTGGQMARDMTLFVDDDGKAYHLYASEDNGTLQIAELDDTYTAHTGRYVRAFEGRFMEAPALFKKDGKYWFIGSGCSGWAPNAARSAVEAPTKTVPSLDCTGGGKALSRATAGSFTIPAKRGERSAKPCAAPISGTAATATKSPRRLTRPRICGTARPRRPRVCATARQRHIRPRRPPRGCPR